MALKLEIKEAKEGESQETEAGSSQAGHQEAAWTQGPRSDRPMLQRWHFSCHLLKPRIKTLGEKFTLADRVFITHQWKQRQSLEFRFHIQLVSGLVGWLDGWIVD